VAALATGAACGDKQRAAARVGAAAAVAPCGSWIRDGLRWRPNGLLSVNFALTGTMREVSGDIPLASLEAPVSSRLWSLAGHLSRTGENRSQQRRGCYSAQPSRPRASNRSCDRRELAPVIARFDFIRSACVRGLEDARSPAYTRPHDEGSAGHPRMARQGDDRGRAVACSWSRHRARTGGIEGGYLQLLPRAPLTLTVSSRSRADA